MITIAYDGPAVELGARRLLGRPAESFLADCIANAGRRVRRSEDWVVHLGDTLVFDTGGLERVLSAVADYRGPATTLEFALRMSDACFRDFYSLKSGSPAAVPLPILATRTDARSGPGEILTVSLDGAETPLEFPASLAERTTVASPAFLLTSYEHPFDSLFANQIAVLADLRRRVSRSPLAWLMALRRRERGFVRRCAMAYRHVDRTAEVHPTAIIEGSVIGPGCRIGAHCVVRGSHLADRVVLFDGAKVEYSVVGPGSWLMHDLVLYRSNVEDDVFLIHGPYQFSSFESTSAAFATIMMDYRPDARPIHVQGPDGGLVAYQGRFLGAVLREGAKTLGGSVIGPGRVVAAKTWLACDPKSIHSPGLEARPELVPLAP